MAQVSDFIKDSATLTIEGGSEPTTITYRPSRMNDESTSRFRRYVEEEDSNAFTTFFLEVVSDWNLTGPLYAEVPVLDDNGETVRNPDTGGELIERRLIVSDGETIPLRVDVVRHIPTSVLTMIWQKLNEDMIPNQPTRGGSRKRR